MSIKLVINLPQIDINFIKKCKKQLIDDLKAIIKREFKKSLILFKQFQAFVRI